MHSLLSVSLVLLTDSGTTSAFGHPQIEPVGSLDREALIHWMVKLWTTTLV